MELSEIRTEIDAIDKSLTQLLVRRMEIVGKVAQYKKENGMPILDTARERNVINQVSAAAGEEYEQAIRQVYETLFTVSRSRQADLLDLSTPLTEQIDRAVAGMKPQMPNRAMVACQGTEGAYSQKACCKMFDFPTILYMKSFDDVFSAVEKGMCPYGVLPIENSTAGSVSEVYDLMEKHRFHIVRSVRQRVEHHLLAMPGIHLEDVREVVSTEQALRQCSQFFEKNPKIKAVPMASTAVAAEFASHSQRRDVAAISSRESADLYGLSVISDSVSDVAGNFTRFICIARNMEMYAPANKISLMLRIRHEPGSLHALLACINARGVNLTKLESRPMPDLDFEFRFFFDLEGNLSDPGMKRLMSQLEAHAEKITLLGNYEELI